MTKSNSLLADNKTKDKQQNKEVKNQVNNKGVLQRENNKIVR